MNDDERTIIQPDDDGEDRPGGAGDDDPTLVPGAGGPGDATVAPGGPDGAAPPDEPTHPQPEQLLPGTDTPERIGPYRLIRPIGEGGMGQVFEAEQMHPIRRTVALKIVKRGMDTAEFISRFESERQALALMDHPAIARVFDAGATPRGRPYFVMEYVDGVPLNTYCDEHRLDLRERLELFIHVCEGVQHAHQKAIIHRDLKPSNVLVTEVDGQPVPKIIDFGVAKATDRDLVENTMKTGMGQVLGTPAYMSPEQASLDAQDMDTRADVYALGVILYELIAGERPFPKAELEAAGFREALRMIREDDPPRPSDRFATLAERRGEVAGFRDSDPTALRRRLRGDLDWITMKALEKDRGRRYTTAYGLAQDIKRYLTFQPVSAGPPTASYRVGKFIRRHRAGVVAGALVTVALVLGVTGTTVGLIRAVRAERMATEEARTATRVTDFLVRLFEVSDPDRSKGETVTARELLDQGADRIDTELVGEPRVRARLLTTIGKVYRNLGLYEAARPYLESAADLVRRDDEASGQVGSLAELGDLYIQLGRYDEATAVLEEAVARLDDDATADQLPLAASLHELANVKRRSGRYEQAEPLYLRARAIRVEQLGGDDPAVASTDNSLAALYWSQGDYGEAERRYRQALDVWERAYGDDHSDVAKGLNNLALLYHQLDRFEEAEALYRRAIPIYERILGPDHPRLARAENNLGLVLQDLGRYDEAERRYRRALAIKTAAVGPDHPDVARTINNLGNLARDRGRYAAADSLYGRALALRVAALGDEHPDIAWTWRDVGLLEDARGDRDAAVAALEKAYSVFAAVNGVDHPELAEILDDLGDVLMRGGDLDGARGRFDRAREIRAATFGPDDWEMVKSLNHLGELARRRGDLARADSLLARALDLQTEDRARKRRAATLTQLGLVHDARGETDRALAHLQEAYDVLVGAYGDAHPDLAGVLDQRARVLEHAGRDAEAARARARAAGLREAHAGSNP